jgi:transposase
MGTGSIIVEVSATDRQQLAAIVADRNTAQKHVWRARILLLTADGCGTAEIMRRAGTSKTAVWRWQKRFMTEGVEGLLRDKTRPSRIPPLSTAVEQGVVARTLLDPPGETTHWTATAMARESGISISSVQRIWRRHGLRPHRVPSTTRSRTPDVLLRSVSVRHDGVQLATIRGTHLNFDASAHQADSHFADLAGIPNRTQMCCARVRKAGC